jgi:hypothetical protein
MAHRYRLTIILLDNNKLKIRIKPRIRKYWDKTLN